MSALAVSLLLAVELTLDTFTIMINSITSTGTSAAVSRDSLGRYVLGQSYSNPGQESGRTLFPIPAKFFGIERTEHTYSDAISKGLEVYFGTDIGRLNQEPGYYVVFLRSILRSSTILVEDVSNIFSSGNLFDIANGITGLIDAIRRSKLIAAMNVFAHLGDQALLLDESQPTDPARPSMVDDLPSGLPNSAIAKSRDENSLRLAWRASTSPMSFLLPASLRNAGTGKQLRRKISSLSRAYGGNGGLSTMYAPDDPETTRIPTSAMRKLEQQLESEYMPFYFHDMRTNEITAFHAFLSNLTDSYTVNHDTIEAYGRIDPIKIYKNTHRSINLSFMVVSTGEDDFDVMWMKINKLMTLIYPQWSEGVVKFSGNDSFIQPFSQVPAASPVFRLRIGDVIKSNYSRFALRRIFGYGTSNFKSGDITAASLSEQDESTQNGFSDFRNAREAEVNSTKSKSELDEIRTRDNYLLKPAPMIGYPKKGTRTSSENLKNTDLRRVRVEKITLDNKIEVSDSNGNTYVVLAPDLIELKDDAPPAAKSEANSEKIDQPSSNINFNAGSLENPGPDAKANTIVRSFESAMSKGIACVASNITFNWLENTTWETEIFGSRAPKVIKIEMNLTPMHDIAPGLDAYGANRAPIYNVGQYANLLGDDDPQAEDIYENNRRSMWERKG